MKLPLLLIRWQRTLYSFLSKGNKNDDVDGGIERDWRKKEQLFIKLYYNNNDIEDAL